MTGRHQAADENHAKGKTYPGTKHGASVKALEKKVVEKGWVKPGTTPHEGEK